jgi:hypothetical protein
MAAGWSGVQTGPGQTALIVSLDPMGERVSLLDSDTLGDELVGEYSDHGDLGALGHGVVEERWGSSVCD